MNACSGYAGRQRCSIGDPGERLVDFNVLTSKGLRVNAMSAEFTADNGIYQLQVGQYLALRLREN